MVITEMDHVLNKMLQFDFHITIDKQFYSLW